MNKDIVCNVNYIKMFMEDNNISSNKLAREIGISPATLSRVLNKERTPGQLVIGRMLVYFDVKFEELFHYGTPLTKVNDENKDMVV